jgi:anti-sigma-K factor RskA
VSRPHDEPGGHERYRDDLAAYALGSLDERQAAELQDHLHDCEACRAHLRWLQPAVDLLGRSVEQVEPPGRLRKRLAATVQAEAREATRAGAEGARPSRLRDWGTILWRPATAVAAATLIVAGAAAGYLLREPGQSTSVVTARPSPGAPAALAGTLERQDGSAILTMSHLPALRAGQVYEAWIERNGALQPSSLFVPRRDRTADAAVPGPLDGADAVLVTREPRGGSQRPTSPPLLRAELH